MNDYADLICAECTYPYPPETPEACGNPICLSNPSLSAKARQMITDRTHVHRLEIEAREMRQRMAELSLGHRKDVPS